MIIYKITNKLNNKCYIGQTSETLQKRVKRHFGYQCKENDTKFYRVIRKYGKDNFYFEQIDESNNQDELDEKEVYWIHFYDSVNNGYNSKNDKGKCGGDTLTHNPNLDKIREKISKSKLKELNPNSTCIKVTNIKTSEELIFNSMIECQERLFIPYHSIISKRCKHKILKPYKNIYQFEYIEKSVSTNG